MKNPTALFGMAILAATCNGQPDRDITGTRSALTESSNGARASSFLDSCLSAVRQAPDFGKGSILLAQSQAEGQIRPLIAELPRDDAEFFAEISRQLTALSCQSRSREELATLAWLASALPARVATSEAIDCLIGSDEVEDAVVWNALDTWMGGRLPKTPVTETLRARAQDSRTQNRLIPPEEFVEISRDIKADRVIVAGDAN